MAGEMLVYRPVAWATQAVFAIMRWRVQATGEEHIPRTGAVILATNHISYVDPLIVGMPAWSRGRRLSFLAKRELFANPVIGALLRKAGTIEVDRGGLASASLGPAVERLHRGDVIAIFPEGTISTSFVPSAPRLGVARLALESGTPVVPGALWGGQRLVTKDRRELRRHMLTTVRLGEAIAPTPGEDPRHLTARIWEAVGRLVDQSARDYPESPSGADDTWWLPAHLGGTAPTVEVALRRAREESELRRAARQAAREAS